MHLIDDCDRVHLPSFGIELKTEKETNGNERSYSVALLCADLFKNMVCELQRVLQNCDGVFCSLSVTYDGAVLL